MTQSNEAWRGWSLVWGPPDDRSSTFAHDTWPPVRAFEKRVLAFELSPERERQLFDVLRAEAGHDDDDCA